MPFKLEDAKKLSQDKLTSFVIDEFRKSPLLDAMEWDDILKPQGGQSFTYLYNRVTTYPTASGRAINTEYAAQEPATTQVPVTAKIFGGAFEIDRAVAAHETQVINLVNFLLQQKTQATVALFNDWFINGDSAANATSFDGIDKAITGSTTEHFPSSAVIDLSSAAAIESNWREFLYELRQTIGLMDGAPTIIAVNNALFTAIQTVADYTSQFTQKRNDLGAEVVNYGAATIMNMGDKPGTSDPIIPISGTLGETSLYTMRIGIDGVHAVTPDGMKAPKVYLPNLKDPGAVKLGEVEMIAAAVLKATRSAAVLRKIKVA